MNKIDYEIVDNFCEVALKKSSIKTDEDWLKENKNLFQSVNIQPIGLPGIANCYFEGVRYEHCKSSA